MNCPRSESHGPMRLDADGDLACVQCGARQYAMVLTQEEAQAELSRVPTHPARMTGIYAGVKTTVPRVPLSRSQALRKNADYFRDYRARKKADAASFTF